MSPNRSVTLIIVAIVAALGGMLMARLYFSAAPQDPRPALRAGTELSPPRALPSFSFVDHSGAAFTEERLENRWTFMFFGFTHCPDVCPMTLTQLANIEKAVSDLPLEQRPQVVLLSVDPERDGQEQLAQYVRFFSPSFVAIRADAPSTEQFTRAMGVPVARRDLENGNYTVDHSSAIFLIGPRAQLRALFTPPHDPAAIIEDYHRLVSATDDTERS